ncbi:CDP-diacylglycerol--glycerol-3-phosphate 3-phosphatidyltransferase [Minwuia sp.]|uniref:CDP-diacylglycerol--glycerol-3-phosphate 3-phosphatidyltransferase n=1 Tax=Minwuia sp. TaxID=2493630 RepID=UPI003A9514B9
MNAKYKATGLRRQVPNLLTAARIVVIPVLILAFYLDPPLSDWLPLVLFVLASATDWFDGKLARAWNARSKLGQFMDPIADKLLVVAVILMLAVTGDISGVHVIPAIAILCREMFISGLREFLAFRNVEMPVSNLAKWKTTAQMTALTILLVPLDAAVVPGLVLLWVSAVLAVQTGWVYLSTAMPHFREDAP